MKILILYKEKGSLIVREPFRFYYSCVLVAKISSFKVVEPVISVI